MKNRNKITTLFFVLSFSFGTEIRCDMWQKLTDGAIYTTFTGIGAVSAVTTMFMFQFGSPVMGYGHSDHPHVEDLCLLTGDVFCALSGWLLRERGLPAVTDGWIGVFTLAAMYHLWALADSLRAKKSQF